MESLEPDMVLDKPAVDADGEPVGQVVDVGLFNHGRVKFIVVHDRLNSVPIRRFGIDDIQGVSAELVTLRVLASS